MASYDPYTPRRIRINISNKAFHIIKNDESCFDNINHKCRSTKISDKIINTLIKSMDLSEIKRPTGRKPKYDGLASQSMKFDAKLSKNADAELEKYDIKNKGAFVSSLLETYADYAYYMRERLYFAECIEKINDIMARGNLISVRYRNDEKGMLIYPYDVRTDEWSSYNYLIGTDITDTDHSGKGKLVNLRISYISSYKAVPLKSSHSPHCYSHDEIEERIAARGIQFIDEEPATIKVRLPKGLGNGKDMYDHMVFMRPVISEMPVDPDDDIYTFRCTEKQAEYYFFKFGAKVEIIEPESLRNLFLSSYKEAYTLYNK